MVVSNAGEVPELSLAEVLLTMCEVVIVFELSLAPVLGVPEICDMYLEIDSKVDEFETGLAENDVQAELLGEDKLVVEFTLVGMDHELKEVTLDELL